MNLTQKMKAPEGMSSFSFSGTDVAIPEDGIVSVTLNPALVEAMKAHGFTEFVEESEDDEQEVSVAEVKPVTPTRRARK